jgi:hypothetical protein
VNAAAERLPSHTVRQAPRLNWPLLWTIVVMLVLAWGRHAHLDRYISPQRGIGYWLGIVGGSMMVLLLIYSARKRAPWLRWIGSIPAWFDIHMTLGVVGPILVLFHSNFRLGATNSNVALFSMLLVAGSGVIGRYIYTRLHARRDGHEDTLEQLKAAGTRLAAQSDSIAFLPGMIEALEGVEKRFIEPPKNPLLKPFHLGTGALRVAAARWVMRSEIEQALTRARTTRPALMGSQGRLVVEAARLYAKRRLDAGRRTTEYQVYARLFSYWHILHLPLFFMLLIAGIVHVVAVNVY